ncbi:MAG: ABC transporter permease [Thermomicrobiales bacterium]|nr:ABC transporter permease [Thermomicrobiales bacterium]MCO5220654.1 ABC transporter permease [Thermomicrobiales bacterium]
MGSYIVGRLLQSIPVLFLTSVVVFLMIRAIPGDPALILAGQSATEQQVAALHQRLGLDEPVLRQYINWVGRLLHGDLGMSYVTNRPVSELILSRIPATLHLSIGAMLVITLFGVPIGILSAIRPTSIFSKVAILANSLLIAVPSFWLGILLILLFAVSLQWLPASGYVPIWEDPVDSIVHLILPSFTLGAYGTAVMIRFLNASIRETMGSDHIRTAYAKGLNERGVVERHVLRISLLPVVTIMAIQFGQLLSGAVVTEAIFGWPGIGRLIVDSVGNREYQILQSTMLIFVFMFIVLNILADACYALLDPRIRLS